MTTKSRKTNKDGNNNPAHRALNQTQKTYSLEMTERTTTNQFQPILKNYDWAKLKSPKPFRCSPR